MNIPRITILDKLLEFLDGFIMFAGDKIEDTIDKTGGWGFVVIVVGVLWALLLFAKRFR